MPGSIKKDLYLAKSVHALNELASAIPKVNSARMYATTAEKVYRGAEEAYMLGDEERSYVLYMKYFNVVSAIKKSADYKKQSKFIDELIGKKNCLNAITKAEELSASLKTRYEEAEAIEVSKKLDSLEIKKNSEDSEESEKLEDSSGTKEKANNDSTATQSKPDGNDKSGSGVLDGGMDVHTIYRLLKDPDVRLILMDVRSTNDFTESHISSAKVISVPESAVAPGCTVSQIEKHLPGESRKIWKTRGSVDYVVLFDWRCSASTLIARSTLTYLKDALFKWDQETILRSEPLIMEGGYEEWLICYPPLTTNPGVRCPLPPVHATAPDLPSLDSIDYDVELDFLKSPTPASEEPEPSESAVPTPVLQPAAVPRFDRSTKPKPGTVMNNATSTVLKDSKPDFSGVRIVNKIDHSPSSPPANRKVENIPPRANISDKNTNAIGSTLAATAAAAAAAAAVPSVDRTKKPSKTVSQPPVVAVRPSFSSSEDEDVDPLPGAVEQGASGGGFGGMGAAELKQLMELRNLKEQEAKSLADIMRKKKKMEEEMKKEEKEAHRKRIERNESLEHREADNRSTKTDDLLSPERNEKETVNQVSSPDDSDSDERTSRNRATETNCLTVKPSTAGPEKVDDAKITEQERQKEEEIEEERHKTKEREQANEREAEKQRQAEIEAEKKRRAELESAAKETERVKAELLKQRELEAAKIQQKEKEAKEKEKQVHDAEAKQKVKQGEGHVTVDKSRKDAAPGQGSSEVSLPAGWEKKYDEANKKYYYIDHNSKKTYWHPPGTQQQKQGDGHAMIYKERLKEEGSGSGGGLKRSHSSPNIAKMIQDEEDASRRMRQAPQQPQQQPQVDRTVKPKPSPQMFTVKTEVAEAKVRNLQPTWGSMGCGLTGLRNLGNTCYMNSTLQCLSNAAPLTVYFLTDWYTQDVVRDSSRRYRGEVASEYAVLVKAIWRGQYKALSPRDFRGVVCKMQPMFSSNQHQDSHELLEILMNGLNEDLNRVRHKPQLPEQNNDNIPDEVAAKQVWKQSLLIEDSIIVDLFRGQYKSTLSCMSCDKKSVMFEPFMCLNLPIPSPTRCSLSDCLLHFSKEEKMVGDSRWHCPRCKSYQDAVKRIVIWKLPPILIVHLERFYYQGIWRDKITANVDFPIDGLDMNRYISGPPERPLYSLFAVSNHFGTLDGGHYTAYCKSPVVGKWYKFDDQDVSETSRSDIKSSAAYMLFYSSMKMDQLKL